MQGLYIVFLQKCHGYAVLHLPNVPWATRMSRLCRFSSSNAHFDYSAATCIKCHRHDIMVTNGKPVSWILKRRSRDIMVKKTPGSANAPPGVV